MKKIAYDQMYENELTHPWYIFTRRLLIETLKYNIDKDAKILDAGCGTGGTISKLTKSGFKRISGIDKSNYAINFCKKRQIKNVSIGNINKLPFKNNSFDAVICLDVLYHQNLNIKLALKEIHRVLKKNGLFYLQEPAFNWLKSKHDIAIQTNQRFSKKTLSELVRSNKFKVIKVSYYNFILFPLMAIKRFIDRLKPGIKVTSDVNKLPLITTIILTMSLKFENYLFTKSFSSVLPYGLSIIVVSKK
ncbi:MAG: class I SAM-dependent methyltransferase [bacterium]|nr:class I SAM-dependent methyltransferase [bacterium]